MFTLDTNNNHEQIALASILFGSALLATIICNPMLVIIALFALAIAGVVFGIASAIRFEACELDLYTPKADSAFVAHVATKQAQRHSIKTSVAMQRARKQKLSVALWDLSVKMSADAGIPFPPQLA